jgi:hypothetical protein
MTIRERRLGYFTETMRQLRRRYEVTDDVMSYIKKSLDLSNLQKQSGGLHPGEMCFDRTSDHMQMTPRMKYPPPGSRTKNWCEIILRNPRFFLRLSLTLDRALARGQFPSDDDMLAMFSQLQVSSSNSPGAGTNPTEQDLDQPWIDFSDSQKRPSGDHATSPYMFTNESLNVTVEDEHSTTSFPEPAFSVVTAIDTLPSCHDQVVEDQFNLDYFEIDHTIPNPSSYDIVVDTDRTWSGGALEQVWELAGE